jgi:hypothetical protein
MIQVKDLKTGKVETILKSTTNSHLVTRTKLTDKGISCDNWFDQSYFTRGHKNYQFEIIESK